jgi:hypothetical protein
MPTALKSAHSALDDVVDGIYTDGPLGSDEMRLNLLFRMYEAFQLSEDGNA